MEVQQQFHFVIVGAGLAGLYAALCASENGKVTLITKTDVLLSNSYWAQGGIAAAIDHDDFYLPIQRMLDIN